MTDKAMNFIKTVTKEAARLFRASPHFNFINWDSLQIRGEHASSDLWVEFLAFKKTAADKYKFGDNLDYSLEIYEQLMDKYEKDGLYYLSVEDVEDNIDAYNCLHGLEDYGCIIISFDKDVMEAREDD